MLKLLSQLESLINRVIESRPPESVAVKSFLIWSAMNHLLHDSFTCYDLLKRKMILVLENLCQMPYNSCVAAFEVYKRGASQANKLWEFYDWCRVMEFCESYEYPFVERIPEIQLRALEKFVNEMWQGTESSSSSPSLSTATASPISLLDFRAVIVTTKWEEFEDVCFPGKVERESLIKWSDDYDDGSWEDLLEASVNLDRRNVEKKDQWQMQVFNPEGLNPFLHASDS